MKNIKVFQVVSNEDGLEGRGRPIVVGNFSNKEVAEDASYGQGVMGTKADVQKNIIQIFDTIDEYTEHTGRKAYTKDYNPNTIYTLGE